jgi:dihydroneopterin triphosphate diphosphatase
VKTPVSCLVVIYCKQGVLLLERQDRLGFWQSVTGSIEPGEHLLDTASRELNEETGFKVQQGVLKDYWWANQFKIDAYWRHRYAQHVLCNTEHVFGFCLPQPLLPDLSRQEHIQYEWLDWKLAILRVFSPSNAQAIEWIATCEGINL